MVLFEKIKNKKNQETISEGSSGNLAESTKTTGILLGCLDEPNMDGFTSLNYSSANRSASDGGQRTTQVERLSYIYAQTMSGTIMQ